MTFPLFTENIFLKFIICPKLGDVLKTNVYFVCGVSEAKVRLLIKKQNSLITAF
jgi:hypothetical protein